MHPICGRRAEPPRYSQEQPIWFRQAVRPSVAQSLGVPLQPPLNAQPGMAAQEASSVPPAQAAAKHWLPAGLELSNEHCPYPINPMHVVTSSCALAQNVLLQAAACAHPEARAQSVAPRAAQGTGVPTQAAPGPPATQLPAEQVFRRPVQFVPPARKPEPLPLHVLAVFPSHAG